MVIQFHERDLRLRPALARGEIGRDRHLEILGADDVLEDAIAGIVPNVDAEREMGPGLHGAAPQRPWRGRERECYTRLQGWEQSKNTLSGAP